MIYVTRIPLNAIFRSERTILNCAISSEVIYFDALHLKTKRQEVKDFNELNVSGILSVCAFLSPQFELRQHMKCDDVVIDQASSQGTLLSSKNLTPFIVFSLDFNINLLFPFAFYC